MVYLGILVAVAALGLLRLWLQQRRQRRNDADLGSMKQTLERVSTRPPVTAAVRERGGTPDPARPGRGDRGRRSIQPRRRPMRSQPSRRSEPLDQERRDAARRRIKERRAARSRAVG